LLGVPGRVYKLSINPIFNPKPRRMSLHTTRQYYYDLILMGKMTVNEFLVNLGVDLTYPTQYIYIYRFYQSMKVFHKPKLKKESKKLIFADVPSRRTSSNPPINVKHGRLSLTLCVVAEI
jgi:hypothetical protein